MKSNIKNCTSFQSGVKRFKEHYGEIDRKSLADFFDMKKQSVYENIEFPLLGTSMGIFKKTWKRVKDNWKIFKKEWNL